MPTDPPDWLQEIDHTGDVGLRITAGSLPQLFERAAGGMFSVLTDPDAVRPAETTDVSVEGPDREALMVRWLSELNYHHTVHTEIKAVTFHGLEIRETTDGWTVQVIFDM